MRIFLFSALPGPRMTRDLPEAEGEALPKLCAGYSYTNGVFYSIVYFEPIARFY
jgi:hypothetical protein